MEAPDRQHTSESAVHATLGDNVARAEPSASGTGSRTDGNEYSFLALNVNNVVHQRRRVNPESLALRLGPDLVRDLDALITPGNTEMPSFAVREGLQERYNIDRRHIYDYFHSRGLRVVKEDKHGNPMAVNDLPTPLPNLRPLRQVVPIKASRSHPSYPVAAERKLFKSRGVTKAKPGRPKKNPSTNSKTVPITCETNESADTDAPVSEHSPGAVPAPTYVSVNPLLPYIPLPPMVEEDENCTFNSVVNPLDESFSVRRAIGDIAYAYRHKLVFERMQELTEYPAKLALTDDRSLLWNETSPCSASGKGLLLPHVKPLTRDERHAIYETLSDSLGPAHGIQECQGTYRKHMEARTKLYFEGPVSVPCHHSQHPARTNPLLDRKPPLGTNEFRHWLSETRFLKRDGINGSPRLHASHRNANVAKQQDIDGIIDKQYRQRTDPHWIQTLDELFLPPGGNVNQNSSISITDSPVVHAREVARMTAHAQDVAGECSAGDQLLLSVMSSPSLPILPDTSVPEIRQTGQAQFHGLSGFSGPQDVNTQMPVVEMDARPQWLEHVPYVAYSGRGAALSETQRRGRSMANGARSRLPSSSPRKPQIRDPDRIWTRPVTSCDARRRTSSAAGDI